MKKHFKTMKIQTSMLLTALLFNSVASANNLSATQTTSMQVPAKTKISEDGGKRLSVLTGMEYSQKIAVDEQGQRESSTDFALALGYRANDLTTLSAKAVASKDNAGQKDTTISDTQLIVAIKGYTFNDRLTSAHSITGVLPTSEDSKKRDRLQTALSVSNGLDYLAPFIQVSYRLGITKNIHEFDFNAEGKANVEYSLRNLLSLDIPVYRAFHVSVEGTYKNGWTYGGFTRSSFGFSADLNYDISNTLAINLGTSNEGSALKANGVDSNIAAYDDDSSVLRAGLSYVY